MVGFHPRWPPSSGGQRGPTFQDVTDETAGFVSEGQPNLRLPVRHAVRRVAEKSTP